ncbi:MAG: hypothetical protein Phog2KO_42830 [Phototrophicaceae bacterium]
MVAINFLSRIVKSPSQIKRPNIVKNFILRMTLGLFASMLPLFLFRFMVSFGFLLNRPDDMVNWQTNWLGAWSGTFLVALTLSLIVTVIIQFATFTPKLLKRYGRFAGRFTTIMVTGLSMMLPYLVLILASNNLVVPMFIVACFVPIITFMVVSSATKYYLLQLRIYYDAIA